MRRLHLASLTLAATLGACTTGAQPDRPDAGANLAIGNPVPDAPFGSDAPLPLEEIALPAILFGGSGPVWTSPQTPLGENASAYLELSGMRIDDGADFALSIETSSGEALSYSAREVSERTADGIFTSGLFYAASFRIKISNLTKANGVRFSGATAYVNAVPALDEERCAQRARIQGLWSSTAALAIERPEIASYGEAVAMLMIGSTTCTGFLIAPDLLVTNYHCAKKSLRFKRSTGEQRACDDIDVHFDYRSIRDLRRDPSTGGSVKTKATKCESVVAFDPDRPTIGSTGDRANGRALDYAVLKLASTPPTDGAGARKPLRLAPRAQASSLGFFLFSHPQNWEQHRSGPCDGARGPDLAGYSREVFAHECDTLEGSSGAPLLTRDYAVAGLHFGSDPNASGVSAQLHKAYKNYATPIGEILADPKVGAALRSRGVEIPN